MGIEQIHIFFRGWSVIYQMHLCTVLVRILMQEDKRIVGCHSESFMIDWLFKFVLNLKSRSLSVLSRLFNRIGKYRNGGLLQVFV